LEFRAAAPKNDPPQPVIDAGRTVTVKTWSIPYLIGEKRGTIDGITEWVPAAELPRRLTGGGPEGGSTGGRSSTGVYAGVGLAAAVLAAGIWLVSSRVRGRRAA
jgi:hypothetical protein